MPSIRQRIAVMTPLEMEYSGRLLDGALTHARAHREVEILDLPYPVDSPNRLRLPCPLPFDGAVIWATREARWVERLIDSGMPLVSASGDWPTDRIPCVSFDPEGLVERAVDHLAALRPAVLVHLQFRITGVPQIEGRCRQFEKAAERHRIPSRSEQIFLPGEKWDSALARRSPLAPTPRKRLERLLRRLPKPAAVWCGADELGLRVCEAAAEIGLEIPNELAVLGTGDFRVAECAALPLSSLPLPGELIGARAVELLAKRLAGRHVFAPFTPVMPPPVVVRASTVRRVAGKSMERALALIEAHCCQGIKVSEIATAVRLSPQSLHTRFIQHLGRSPGEEIRRARLAKAKRMLQDPRLSVARVATMCGFNQQSKFTAFFRRGTGESPRDWRKTKA